MRLDIDKLRRVALGRVAARHTIPASDREDIVQDSLIEAVRAVERDAPDSPEALVRTITDRRVIDFLRRRETRRAVETPVGLNTQDISEAGLITPTTEDEQLFTTEFDLAVRALPEPLRESFVLTDLRGMTVREAAEFLGLPKSTVADRVTEARAWIRKEVTR